MIFILLQSYNLLIRTSFGTGVVDNFVYNLTVCSVFAGHLCKRLTHYGMPNTHTQWHNRICLQIHILLIYIVKPKDAHIRRTLVGNKIVDHCDVVGASPIGAAPTTSSFSTWHLASRDSAKKAARQYENLLSVGIGAPYIRDLTVYIYIYVYILSKAQRILPVEDVFASWSNAPDNKPSIELIQPGDHLTSNLPWQHYSDVIMGAMPSQVIGLPIACSTVFFVFDILYCFTSTIYSMFILFYILCSYLHGTCFMREKIQHINETNQFSFYVKGDEMENTCSCLLFVCNVMNQESDISKKANTMPSVKLKRSRRHSWNNR